MGFALSAAAIAVFSLVFTASAEAANFQGSSGGCSIGIGLDAGSYFAKVWRNGGTCGTGTTYRARVDCQNTSTGAHTIRTGGFVHSGNSQANCVCPCPGHERPVGWGVGIKWPDGTLHNHWMVGS